MKKLILCIIVFLISINILLADTWVNGYTKKNGTYVSGHYRSDANSTVQDNWSYKGNVNPWTGRTGSNYYRDNPTSEYYNPGSSSRVPTRPTPIYTESSSVLGDSIIHSYYKNFTLVKETCTTTINVGNETHLQVIVTKFTDGGILFSRSERRSNASGQVYLADKIYY
jgi:hypothetical protein